MDSPFPPAVAFVERNQPPEGAPGLRPEEEEALGPASSPRRRAQFALGRACAREALARLGVPGEPVIVREGDRQPRWPTGYVGSIAHSHDHAAAAVAPARAYCGLGVDLERLRHPSDALLERITRPTEREILQALPEAVLALAFTVLFAAKESIYKAINPLTGIYLGFGDAEVSFKDGGDWSGGGGPFAWTLLKDTSPGYPAGRRGQGAWCRSGEWVAAGVWIPVSGLE